MIDENHKCGNVMTVIRATKQKIFVSSQKDYILHMTKLNDNINMDSTIAGSINAGSCITIT
jgi:DNA-binding FrmR family transcriptional regulator